MKKMMKFFGFVAVAAMSLTACQNDIDEQVNINEEGVTIEFYAESPTRSLFGDKVNGSWTSSWTGNETVRFSINEDMEMPTAKATAGETTNFTVTFPATSATSGNIYAMAPKGSYSGTIAGGFTQNKLNSQYKNTYLVIPWNQKPTDESVEEGLMPVVATHAFTDGIPSSVALQFNHALAYGRMSIEDFAGGNLKTVTIEFPKAVAGTSCKYYYTAKDTYKAGNIDGMDQKIITIDCSQLTNFYVWFGVAPIGTLTGNLKLTIVDDEDNVFTKELQTNGKLSFNQGKVSSFTVSMDGCEAIQSGLALPFEDTFDWTSGDQEITTNSKGYAFTKVYADGKGAIKFGTRTVAGKVITPALDLSQQFTVILKAKAWTGDATTLNITSNGTTIGSAKLTDSYQTFYFTSDAIGSYATIQIAPTTSENARGHIDEIKVLAGEILPTASAVVTTAAASQTATAEGTTATMNASFTTEHVTDEVITGGFEYKLSSDASYTSVEGIVSGNAISYDLTNLITDSEYTYRAWLKFDDGEKIYGSTVVFTPTVQGATQTINATLNCVNHTDFKKWDSSYKARTIDFDDATIKFSSANKQSTTITDCPVTKGKPIEVIMKNGATLSKVTFNLKKWGSKAQTVTLHTSTNGGTTYTKTTKTSRTFTLTEENLPEGCNAVKITFSSTSNQVGLASVDVTYTK